jgi:hypothetical protein
MGRVKRVTLETTLKPFARGLDDDAVAEEVFTQWAGIVAEADSVSILVWTGDGSEILEWADDLDASFEWARYVGFSNPEQFGLEPNGPTSARPFRDGTGPLTYRRLRDIVGCLRAAALRRVPEVTIGTIFDPGPEFVPSSFKFERHPEMSESPLDLGDAPVRSHYHVTCSWSRLHADSVKYAAFPDGIPEGLSFGTFLGRQTAAFFPAVGFDYLWLSNGFGFSFHPWSYRGINFDGHRFGLVDAAAAAEFVLSFWTDFAAVCDVPLEARGTNFPIGVELAKDLTPLRSVYREGYLRMPAPNSPWGALNRNFGVELAGAMSRAASAPGNGFPFRFYVNDPWFWQNPWRDCYGREPYDIYMPLSTAALRGDGSLERASVIEVLTVDTEYGILDGRAAGEVVPHLLSALDTSPDRPGLVCWVYPFDEMFDMVEADPGRAASAFFQDWFVAQAITSGAPINSVVSSGDLATILATEPGLLEGTVLLACASTIGEALAASLSEHVLAGGQVLYYGEPQDEATRRLLGLGSAAPLLGEGVLTVDRGLDALYRPGDWGSVLMSDACSAGGAGDIAGADSTVIASVRIGAEDRAFAVTRSAPEWSGGRASWIRGALPIDEHGTSDLPQRLPHQYVDAAGLVRPILEDFGIVLRHARTPESVVFHDHTIYRENARPVQFTASRADNALWLSGYEQDTTVSLALALPEGVPLPVGETAALGAGVGIYQLSSSFRREVRVYIQQEADGLVACKEGHPISTPQLARVRRALSVSPVVDARLEVHPPLAVRESALIEVRVNGVVLERERIQPTRHGFAIEGITGTVEFLW